MASAQQYDLLLRGGQVVDPGNGVNARLDVAVVGDHIAAIQPNIPASQARKVVDVSNLYVVPGLVDLHMHVFGFREHTGRMRTRCPRGRPRLWTQAAAAGEPSTSFGARYRELADASAGAAEHRGQGDDR